MCLYTNVLVHLLIVYDVTNNIVYSVYIQLWCAVFEVFPCYKGLLQKKEKIVC